MQQPGRLRLRPWLEEQIQSGEYPGVSWLDQAARIFQIPWKHAARHGWSIDRDATLFRSWAMHTGRYRPGKDKPEPKTWKANFRCALNSLADVCELREHSRKRGSDAFRVYRMLPKTHTHTRRRGLRLFKPRDRQTASIHDNRTSSNSNHGDTHTWNQQSVTPVESDPIQKTETAVDTTHGMWDARADEQNEAVFKLMDHLSSDVWNQSGWRTHTLWDHWPCAGDESPYSLQTDGYGELSGSNYIKELSDWSSHQHTLLP